MRRSGESESSLGAWPVFGLPCCTILLTAHPPAQIADRTVVQTTDAERRCTSPPGLQVGQEREETKISAPLLFSN